MNTSTGSFTGAFEAYAPNQFEEGTVTGTVTGSTITMQMSDLHAKYTENFTGTVGPGDSSLSGTWIDSEGKSGTWTGRYSGLAGLVAEWQGNGNAKDAVGTNDGTLIDGSYGPGHDSDQGFDLDGTDDYVTISSSAMATVTGPISASAWVTCCRPEAATAWWEGHAHCWPAARPAPTQDRAAVGWSRL